MDPHRSAYSLLHLIIERKKTSSYHTIFKLGNKNEARRSDREPYPSRVIFIDLNPKPQLPILSPKPSETVTAGFKAKPSETIAVGFEAKLIETVATGFEAQTDEKPSK
jgi:hypothetical protein